MLLENYSDAFYSRLYISRHSRAVRVPAVAGIQKNSQIKSFRTKKLYIRRLDGSFKRYAV